MPRPKSLTDAQILDAALTVTRRTAVDRLTFTAVARACGLSAATLVQRFGTVANLRRRTLHHAWDQLEARTVALGKEIALTPAGAVDLLVGLSGGYDTDIEEFADGLLMLREDLRDPELRRRGARWQQSLLDILDGCLAKSPGASADAADLLLTHWQGAVLWWAFAPEQDLRTHLREGLTRLTRLCDHAAGRDA
jgi:AcrR family transcriptional regulator